MVMRSGFRLAAAALAAGAMVGSGITSAPPVQAIAVTPSQVTTSAAAGSAPVNIPKHTNGRLVFAHYHPFFATSLDNSPAASDYYQNQFLNPNGEGGKWASIGGYLRDRPIAVAPKPGDFLLANAQKEVADAKAAGIDGFALDLSCIKITAPGTPCYLVGGNQQAIFTAAARAGFKVMLQPDMDTEFGSLSQADFASVIAGFAKNSAVYKRSGKVVLSPFRTEVKSASWWKGTLAQLKARGVKVFFMPQFLNLSAIRTSKTKSAWDKISSGYTDWGSRTPQKVSSPASALHKAKKIWMHPVAVQDARPKAQVYWEAGNSATLRATWTNAIKSKADLVMLLTWNDYSEGTAFAPSLRHGYSLLDLNSYYLSWYRTGKAPKVARETVFISHRVHSYTLAPSLGYPNVMKPLGGYAPRDTIEVVTTLKKAAEVRILVDGSRYVTYKAKAGVYVKTVGLRTGQISAQFVRSGKVLGTAATGEAVVSTRPVQDLDYRFASSRR